MSITFPRRANYTSFCYDIDSNMLISYLKKVVKSELHPQFDNVPYKDIKLWKVEIRDNNIGALSNLITMNFSQLEKSKNIGPRLQKKNTFIS